MIYYSQISDGCFGQIVKLVCALANGNLVVSLVRYL